VDRGVTVHELFGPEKSGSSRMATLIISHKIAKIETGKYGDSECD
jgi:hypothetical protein